MICFHSSSLFTDHRNCGTFGEEGIHIQSSPIYRADFAVDTKSCSKSVSHFRAQQVDSKGNFRSSMKVVDFTLPNSFKNITPTRLKESKICSNGNNVDEESCSISDKPMAEDIPLPLTASSTHVTARSKQIERSGTCAKIKCPEVLGSLHQSSSGGNVGNNSMQCAPTIITYSIRTGVEAILNRETKCEFPKCRYKMIGYGVGDWLRGALAHLLFHDDCTKNIDGTKNSDSCIYRCLFQECNYSVNWIQAMKEHLMREHKIKKTVLGEHFAEFWSDNLAEIVCRMAPLCFPIAQDRLVNYVGLKGGRVDLGLVAGKGKTTSGISVQHSFDASAMERGEVLSIEHQPSGQSRAPIMFSASPHSIPKIRIRRSVSKNSNSGPNHAVSSGSSHKTSGNKKKIKMNDNKVVARENEDSVAPTSQDDSRNENNKREEKVVIPKGHNENSITPTSACKGTEGYKMEVGTGIELVDGARNVNDSVEECIVPATREENDIESLKNREGSIKAFLDYVLTEVDKQTKLYGNLKKEFDQIDMMSQGGVGNLEQDTGHQNLDTHSKSGTSASSVSVLTRDLIKEEKDEDFENVKLSGVIGVLVKSETQDDTDEVTSCERNVREGPVISELQIINSENVFVQDLVEKDIEISGKSQHMAIDSKEAKMVLDSRNN